MKVEENLDHKRCCDNCDAVDYVYEIVFDDGIEVLKLCKTCLLELSKAIIER